MKPSIPNAAGRKTWGGARAGAGRPPATDARCHCGKHTLTRAVGLRLKCRKPLDK